MNKARLRTVGCRVKRKSSQCAPSTINHHISADDNRSTRSAGIIRVAFVVQHMSSHPPCLVLLAIRGFKNGSREGGAPNRPYKYYSTSTALYYCTESGCWSQEFWRLLYLFFCQGRVSLLHSLLNL